MSTNESKVRLSEMEEGEMDSRDIRQIKEKKEKKEKKHKKRRSRSRSYKKNVRRSRSRSTSVRKFSNGSHFKRKERSRSKTRHFNEISNGVNDKNYQKVSKKDIKHEKIKKIDKNICINTNNLLNKETKISYHNNYTTKRYRGSDDDHTPKIDSKITQDNNDTHIFSDNYEPITLFKDVAENEYLKKLEERRRERENIIKQYSNKNELKFIDESIEINNNQEQQNLLSSTMGIQINLKIETFKQSEEMFLKEHEEKIIDKKLSHLETEKFLKEINKERDQIMEEIEKKNTINRKIMDEKTNKKIIIQDMFTETPDDDIFSEAKDIVLNLPAFDISQDNRGYFIPRVNEMLNSHYKITAICGKGVFSTVVKVLDINTNVEYAIKVIRTRDEMILSGEKEKLILKKLNENDKSDKNHIVRLINSFDYKKHICLVFELMEMNLRDLLKIYPNGLSLSAVKTYAKQIVIALEYLHSSEYIHADFKLDNIVISKNHKHIKLCDFGSVLSVNEIIITQDLQSRFYRAPEVILGCPYDTKIDIWSLGCTLYELYTGKFLFPGKTNNEMLKLILQVRGFISKKLIKKGKFSKDFFNEKGEFLSIETDPITKKDYIKEIDLSQPNKELLLMLKAANYSEEEKGLLLFKDFLEKCLCIDPVKRWDARKALCHPFLAVVPNVNSYIKNK